MSQCLCACKCDSGKGTEKIMKFWIDISDCLRKFRDIRKVVLIGDMNGRVSNSEVTKVVENGCKGSR